MDFDSILDKNLNYKELTGKQILITGASGMIGSAVVDFLLYLNKKFNYNIKIYALSRNRDRLHIRFQNNSENLFFLVQDICVPINSNVDFDYIIHTASNADPLKIINYPVDTIKANFEGLDQICQYALKRKTRRILFVSSGEVYGSYNEEMDFQENILGNIDYTSVRSSYPEGKRAAEVLAQSYIKQYDLDIVIARPCHIYGYSMTEEDSRAVSSFIRNGIYKQNIIMKSSGNLERSHCNVIDAVGALFYILLKGKRGEAYNIADKKSQCTIGEFASLVAQLTQTCVIIQEPESILKEGFSKVKRAVLNSDKLEQLGWCAHTTLEEGIKQTIRYIRESLIK